MPNGARTGNAPACADASAEVDGWVARLQAGDLRVLSRAISWIENGDERGKLLLRRLFAFGGRAWVIGITGVPGAGKSTLLPNLARRFLAAGKVAVLAVDPSSPISGGAILGDRLRGADDAGDAIFFRSLGSRGAAGGLSRCVIDVVDLLDAAGYDTILIETVGAGQSEVAIREIAHTVLLLTAPGLGDEVQAMKAGILEIGSIHIVNKADRPGAAETARTLRMALMYAPQYRHLHEGLNVVADGTLKWLPPVVEVSALDRVGLDGLNAVLDQHRGYLDRSGRFAGLVSERNIERLREHAHDLAMHTFWRTAESRGWFAEASALVERRTADPQAAAERLVRRTFGAAEAEFKTEETT
jgi:LAO/AO transport system kinase